MLTPLFELISIGIFNIIKNWIVILKIIIIWVYKNRLVPSESDIKILIRLKKVHILIK